MDLIEKAHREQQVAKGIAQSLKDSLDIEDIHTFRGLKILLEYYLKRIEDDKKIIE